MVTATSAPLGTYLINNTIQPPSHPLSSHSSLHSCGRETHCRYLQIILTAAGERPVCSTQGTADLQHSQCARSIHSFTAVWLAGKRAPIISSLSTVYTIYLSIISDTQGTSYVAALVAGVILPRLCSFSLCLTSDHGPGSSIVQLNHGGIKLR